MTCAWLQLARPDAAEVLEAHRAVAGARMVGIRMILNYSEKDPTLCWPQVDRGDYLSFEVEAFAQG